MQTNTFKAADYLALAFVEILENNPTVINHIYDFVQANYIDTELPQFTLDAFCAAYPADKAIIEGYLQAIMPGELGSISELDDMMEWDEDYAPGVFFENYENANWDLAPIITPGVDVNDELYPEILTMLSMFIIQQVQPHKFRRSSWTYPQ